MTVLLFKPEDKSITTVRVRKAIVRRIADSAIERLKARPAITFRGLTVQEVHELTGHTPPDPDGTYTIEIFREKEPKPLDTL